MNNSSLRSWLLATLLVGTPLALAVASGCSSDSNIDGGSSSSSGSTSSGSSTSSSGIIGSSGASGATSSGASSGTSGANGDGGNVFMPDGAACVPLVLPDGTKPQCADCIDNDGDGKADWQDPECAGPLDNDEKTFGTGIAGDNMDACKQDCFFDGNSGQGDDKCEWNLKCDPAGPGGAACPYDPNFKNCPATQSAVCKQFCAKLTPNGCDCFGCCAVNLPDGSVKNVTLSSTCSLADINDPTKCKACTPNAGCNNPCDRCELCIGKTQVPADCGGAAADSGTPSDGGSSSGGGSNTCTDGIPCNEATPCKDGLYCLTGCCVQTVR
jgi:hypothetical protein